MLGYACLASLISQISVEVDLIENGLRVIIANKDTGQSETKFIMNSEVCRRYGPD